MRFFLFLFFLSSAPFVVFAEQADGCPDFFDPPVAIKPLAASPQISAELNLPSLAAMARENAQNYSSTRHEVPVGLTAAKMTLESDYKIRMQENPRSGTVCAQIASFDLRFGFDDTIVYVAKEIPYPSCGYQKVLDHELRHVAIDRLLVETYTPLLPELIAQAVRDIGSVRAASSESARQQIENAMTDYMKDLGAKLSGVRQKEQAKIDTKDEYARIGESCGGEIAELVGRRR